MGKRKTQEEFEREVSDILGKEYVVLGKYVNSRTKVKIKHESCGYEYETTRESIMLRGGCMKCSGKMKKTTEEFSKEIADNTNGEYELLSEYKNNKTKVTIRHIECGTIFDIRPDQIVAGQRCPSCRYTKARKTHNEFKDEVYDLVRDEYTLLTKYELNNKKVEIKHNECGYEYEVKPNDFLNGRRCPSCRDSKGEKSIARVLMSLGYEFERQYKIDECKHIKPLPFDFCVFGKSGNLLALIEFQGEQHYRPIECFGGKERFEKQIKYDAIKDEYCRKKGINLIKIPYYDADIVEEYVKAI